MHFLPKLKKVLFHIQPIPLDDVTTKVSENITFFPECFSCLLTTIEH